MEIGHILKYYRALHKLTQTEVAERAGINEKYYGKLERDESVPTLDKVEMLCQAFDIRVIDLLATKPTPVTNNNSEESINNSSNERELYYCNCCGTTFDGTDQEYVFCPNCQCEYDESNEYIEEVTI